WTPPPEPGPYNPPEDWDTVPVKADYDWLRERFLTIRLDTCELVATANSAIRACGGEPREQADLGDFAILVGLHVSTKELDDWTWSTFWWHDKPDVGPFAKGRPPALGKPWSNYLMDVAFDAEVPRERPKPLAEVRCDSPAPELMD